MESISEEAAALAAEHFDLIIKVAGARWKSYFWEEAQSKGGEALCLAAQVWIDTPEEKRYNGNFRNFAAAIIHQKIIDEFRTQVGRTKATRDKRASARVPLQMLIEHQNSNDKGDRGLPKMSKRDGFLARRALSYEEGGYESVDFAFDLKRAMSCPRLTEKDKDVLRLRAEGMSLVDIGKKYGVTESRASQLWKEARRHARLDGWG